MLGGSPYKWVPLKALGIGGLGEGLRGSASPGMNFEELQPLQVSLRELPATGSLPGRGKPAAGGPQKARQTLLKEEGISGYTD